MTDDGRVLATWLPSYEVVLGDGTIVQPGSDHLIPAGEAKESDHWKPVKASKPTEKPAAGEEN